MKHLRFCALVTILMTACGGIVVDDRGSPMKADDSTPSTPPQQGDPGPTPTPPPEPNAGGGTVLVDGHAPYTLALTGTAIYFTTQGPPVTVMSCGLAGCDAPSSVATGGDGFPGIAVDANNVYWTSNFGTDVFACPLSGCGTTPTVLAPQQATPHGIASDGDDVFWATDDGIRTCAATGCGGKPTVLSNGAGKPNGIAIDATNVYWTEAESGRVLKCAKVGCNLAPTVLVDAGVWRSAADIAVDATDVYWASPSSTRVLKCAIDGCNGSPTEVATAQAYALAIDGANVYVTTIDSVLKCAKTGCTEPTVLASGQTNPTDVVVDSTHVYWSDRTGHGAIHVIEK
jgi:hypothetical protein